MNELTPKLPPELQETLEQYYSAPAPRPEFAARLEAQLRRNVERRQAVPERMSFMKLAQTRPLLAMLIALLILLALSGVAYAIGRVTGYIPGIGMVDQSTPLRILAEPVVVENEGFTIRVSQVVADSERTTVTYALDGLADMSRCAVGIPSLQLPDGSMLEELGEAPTGKYEIGDYFTREVISYFSPLPADVNHATLTAICGLPTSGEKWQISFDLSPAPAGYATPGIEIAPTFVASGPGFATAVSTLEPYGDAYLRTPVPNGSGLYLERVIEMPNSYILIGNFTNAGDLPGHSDIFTNDLDDTYNSQIKDDHGNPVTFEVREDIRPKIALGDVWYWAYEVAKPVQGPITLIWDHVVVRKPHTTQITFDTGPNPKVGQIWQPNLLIYLPQHECVIDTVEMIDHGYLFKYTGLGCELDLVDSAGDPNADDGQHDWDGPRNISNFIYLDAPPTGLLNVQVSADELISLGPWTLIWTPPNK